MNILDQIIEFKKKEIKERKELYPVKLLEQKIYFSSPTVSLVKYLQRTDKYGIIAEFKRQSPSKGIINAYANIEETSIAYMQAGASALSVLTDNQFFGGKNSDLETARKFNYCPILRKDFVIDEYQIIEARSIGADAILLIAEILDQKSIVGFTDKAKSLQLEVVMEIHSKAQLDKMYDPIDIIGVNNRNLKTFRVDINTSFELLDHLPKDKVKISESGLSNPEIVCQLKNAGYNGFLIGEYFMKSSHPGKMCNKFIEELKQLEA